MKRLRPSAAGGPPEADSQARRRSAFRFGFSAVVASFVVLGLLILGAMFQEEYEEGFVRLVSYAVRLASPEEIAEAEAQGPIPAPLPAIRPDTPVAVITGPIAEEKEMGIGQIVLPAPETLFPIEDLLIETPNGIELALSGNPASPPDAPAAAGAETE